MHGWGTAPGVVELPDGRVVRGTGLSIPREDVGPPELAIYLLGKDPGDQGWPYRWIRWRDFGRPASTADAVAELRAAYDRASSERVEIACHAGRGRTGTALSLLAVIGGIAPEHAVDWVREHYHPKAVETPGQRRWVLEAAKLL